MNKIILLVVIGLMPMLAMAQATPVRPKPAPKTPPAAATSAAPRPGGVLAALPTVLVHKTASCGCCKLWVKHLENAGFRVQTRDIEDLSPVKARLGVPYGKGSCHTAEVAGYFVEGHVPASDIKRLLAEKPKAKGLTVPGMPSGSPGMEMPDGRVQPYAVELIGKDGKSKVFSRHP